MTPIALIGAGGIGKTSVALAVLHHHRIKQRFGENRRFIRCDQFPATLVHLLSRLSKATGAGAENPEDLAPLHPFLSSREMLIILDNAESILDPRGTDAVKIYALVEELSRMGTICLCITSRISTIPPECEIFDVPTLSMKAAQDVFYSVYKKREQSNLIGDILKQLDFHPLSIALLATVAHQNRWGTDRLTTEWERRRTSVLQTEHNKSLSATIELSLASPLFQDLGPDARALLGVVAFFPQGVDEDNLDWLFPTISNGANIFDKFCILSLTYRNNGFITMLAPLRDHLSPKNPRSSSLLCATKELYFSRMAVNMDPEEPNFGETRWITSEDVNVEHLLDVFTTIDADSDTIWKACGDFMEHLYWHKVRLVALKPKIEGLPDDRCFKPGCLIKLAKLFSAVGNHPECKQLLTRALKLRRERGSDYEVADVLRDLSDINRLMDLPKEGIQHVKEALEICKSLGDIVGQAQCSIDLASVLHDDKRFDAAEAAAFHAIDLLPEEGEQFLVCGSHRALGDIYRSKGETGKAIHHLEVALGIASSFDWHDNLFWVHYTLAGIFRDEGRFNDAQIHLERAKSHTVDSAYNLGYAVEEQARVWYKQHRFEEARSEALRAADIFDKLGAAMDVERCREFIQEILNGLAASGSDQSGFDCEFLYIVLSPARIDFLF
jgi:tetratricopeptide (TPR) repeat protein